jgi:MFS superfamily sulfate permease-like transporter
VRRWISVLDWLPHYRRADLPGDVVAGITGAAVLVPQSMAYAQIAHLPPVVGLYASVVPLLVYAVLSPTTSSPPTPTPWPTSTPAADRGPPQKRSVKQRSPSGPSA